MHASDHPSAIGSKICLRLQAKGGLLPLSLPWVSISVSVVRVRSAAEIALLPPLSVLPARSQSGGVQSSPSLSLHF